MKNINFIRLDKNLIKTKDISFQNKYFLNNVLKKYYFEKYHLGYLSLIHRLNPVMEQFEDLNYSIKCELQLINKDTNNILTIGNKLNKVLKVIENRNIFSQKIIGQDIITNNFGEVSLKHIQNHRNNTSYIAETRKNVNDNKSKSIVIIKSINKLISSTQGNINVRNTELNFLNSTKIQNINKENIDNTNLNQSIEKLRYLKADNLSLDSLNNLGLSSFNNFNLKNSYFAKNELISRTIHEKYLKSVLNRNILNENIISLNLNIKNSNNKQHQLNNNFVDLYKLENLNIIKNLTYRYESKDINYEQEAEYNIRAHESKYKYENKSINYANEYNNNLNSIELTNIVVINSIRKLLNYIKSNKNVHNTELNFLNEAKLQNIYKENIAEENVNNTNLIQSIKELSYLKVDNLSLSSLNNLSLSSFNNLNLNNSYFSKNELIIRRINEKYFKNAINKNVLNRNVLNRNVISLNLNIKNFNNEKNQFNNKFIDLYKLENLDTEKNLTYRYENKDINYAQEAEYNLIVHKPKYKYENKSINYAKKYKYNLNSGEYKNIVVINSIRKWLNYIEANKNITNTELRFSNEAKLQNIYKENIAKENIDNTNLMQSIEELRYLKVNNLTLSNLNNLNSSSFNNLNLNKSYFSKNELISRRINEKYFKNAINKNIINENIIRLNLNIKNLNNKQNQLNNKFVDLYKLENLDTVKNLTYKYENKDINYEQEAERKLIVHRPKYENENKSINYVKEYSYNLNSGEQRNIVVINSIRKLLNYIEANKSTTNTELNFLNEATVKNIYKGNIDKENINNINLIKSIEELRYLKIDNLTLSSLNNLNFSSFNNLNLNKAYFSENELISRRINEKYFKNTINKNVINENIINLNLNTKNLNNKQNQFNNKFTNLYKLENLDTIKNLTYKYENKDINYIHEAEHNLIMHKPKYKYKNKNANYTKEYGYNLNFRENKNIVVINSIRKLLNYVESNKNVHNTTVKFLDEARLQNIYKENITKENIDNTNLMQSIEELRYLDIHNLTLSSLNNLKFSNFNNLNLNKSYFSKNELISRRINEKYFKNAINKNIISLNLDIKNLNNKQNQFNNKFVELYKLENLDTIKNLTYKYENKDINYVHEAEHNSRVHKPKYKYENKSVNYTKEYGYNLNSGEHKNIVVINSIRKLLSYIEANKNTTNTELNFLNEATVKNIYKGNIAKEYINNTNLIQSIEKLRYLNIDNLTLSSLNNLSLSSFNNLNFGEYKNKVQIKSIRKLLNYIESNRNVTNIELNFLNETKMQNMYRKNIANTNSTQSIEELRYLKIDNLSLSSLNNLSLSSFNNLNLKKSYLSKNELISKKIKEKYLKSIINKNVISLDSRNAKNVYKIGNNDSSVHYESYDNNPYSELNNLIFKVKYINDSAELNDTIKKIENEHIELKKLVKEEISQIKIRSVNEINITNLSEKVYRNIENKLRLEKQRRGMI